MSNEELNIDIALEATPKSNKQKRKRTNSNNTTPITSEEEEDGVPQQPKVFGNIGTPMPTGQVTIQNGDEWEEWKAKEMEKRARKKYLRSKWDLRKSELPLKSDSKHLMDRHKHYENVLNAQDKVASGVEAINELNFNVGKGEAINIQVNGKQMSKKKSKKFAAAVEKALAEMGNPSMTQMMTDDMDEEEAKAEAEWAAKFSEKSKGSRRRQEFIRDMEEDQKFDPWAEYCVELEEKGKEDKIDEKHYKKWLERKIDDNKVSRNYNAYQLAMLDLDKNGLKDKPKSLKTVMKGVANFYRSLRRKD